MWFISNCYLFCWIVFVLTSAVTTPLLCCLTLDQFSIFLYLQFILYFFLHLFFHKYVAFIAYCWFGRFLFFNIFFTICPWIHFFIFFLTGSIKLKWNQFPLFNLNMLEKCEYIYISVSFQGVQDGYSSFLPFYLQNNPDNQCGVLVEILDWKIEKSKTLYIKTK